MNFAILDIFSISNFSKLGCDLKMEHLGEYWSYQNTYIPVCYNSLESQDNESAAN